MFSSQTVLRTTRPPLSFPRTSKNQTVNGTAHFRKTRILISFSLFICTTQHSIPMAASRKKVQLEPGHTLADWYRLVQSGEDLGGAPRALRIPIEEVN
jgi:hypothetical protein